MKTILIAVLFLSAYPSQAADSKSWNPKTAAAYLDARMDWWSTWHPAERDHDTFCISCHTTLPYALARPALRSALGESAPSPTERTFLANLSKRVSMWPEVLPFYNDAKHGQGKSAEARSTEAVMNALVLARYESPAAANALRDMWALQLKTGDRRGSFTWLDFNNEPWEATDSGFWGASLAALAVGMAPKDYRESPAIRENLDLLAGYLQREQATRSTLHRAVALWASGKLPRLLPADQRAAITQDILSKQREDGGWSESSLVVQDWHRHDHTPLDTASDGYATALMVLALRQSGTPATDPRVARGLAWLEHHQDPGGAWLATSLNKKRDPESDAGRFMNDAATAYAVLALNSR